MHRLTFSLIFFIAGFCVESGADPITISKPRQTLSSPAGGNGDSLGGIISVDGRWVVFTSAAENLVTNDFNGCLDVFAWNRETKEIILVSINENNQRSGNGNSQDPTISEDGRYVLFTSRAKDLVSHDENGKPDIFVRDLLSQTTTLVTDNADNTGTSTGLVSNALVSRNFKAVIFESSDTDAVTSDTNKSQDLFLRNLSTGKTSGITTSGTRIVAPPDNFEPAISESGEFVAYTTLYANLVTNDKNYQSDVYLWNGRSNILVSVSPYGQASGSAQNALISSDGRYVAFTTMPVVNKTNWFVRDMHLGKTIGLVPGAYLSNPDDREFLQYQNIRAETGVASARQKSMDGTWELFSGNENGFEQVYMRERQGTNTLLISVSADGPQAGNGDSTEAQFAGAGTNRVLFKTKASSITGTQTTQLVIRDLDRSTNILVTRNRNGTPSIGMITEPENASMSEDGKQVVYQAQATDLVTNNVQFKSAIYLFNTEAQSNELASITWNGLPPSADSFMPYITPNGRFLLFSSLATNLVEGVLDENNSSDLFLRDLELGTTTLLTVDDTGLMTASRQTDINYLFLPAISENGRFVAFQSTATNVVANDTNNYSDVFIRDTVAGINILASAGMNGGPANGPSYSPLISSDGRYIAFRSRASDLIENGATNEAVYLRDLELGTTIQLPGLTFSIDSSGKKIVLWNGVVLSKGTIQASTFSDDGNKEVYLSNSEGARTNSPSGVFQIYLKDYQSEDVQPITQGSNTPAGSLNGSFPSISSDGKFVVFEAYDANLVVNDDNHAFDIFLYDVEKNSIELISKHAPSLAATSGDNFSTYDYTAFSNPLLLFSSWSTNLVYGVGSASVANLYVYDFSSRGLVAATTNSSNLSGYGYPNNAIISPDQQYLLFGSNSPDLVPGDTNNYMDIFIQEKSTGSTRLLSKTATETLPNGDSYQGSISGDNRWLVFTSNANQVTTNMDGNARSDVFLADLLEKTVTLVSVSTNQGRTGSGSSFNPIISRHGDFVAFTSSSTSLTPNSSGTNLFLYNVGSQTNILLARSSARSQFAGEADSLMYDNQVDFPGLNDTNKLTDLFIYNPHEMSFELLSVNTNGFSGNGASHIGAITPDGRYVVFTSAASDLTTNDNNGTNDIFLRDRVSGLTILISHNSLGESANGDSDSPSISSDGKLIAYRSSATDLVDEEIRAGGQIYVYDVITGQTRLITRSISGNRSSNARAGMPLIRPDGSGIVFKSFATDIVPAKGSSSQDIYYVSLLPDAVEDSDMDGLPDAWERSYFGDLTHNGSADTDSDGQSDLAEFLCGTDPNNAQSVFAGTGIGTLEDGKIVLQWASQPGKRYLVQFKDFLNAEAWTNVGEEIEATTTVTEATDPSSAGNPHRYYRIMLVH